MSIKARLRDWFTGLLGGEYITKKGVDRQLLFIFFCFILVSLWLMWGLWSEARMAEIGDNERVLKELKIEYNEKNLTLTGLDQRTKIEAMLSKSGNSALHAPADPPRRLVIE